MRRSIASCLVAAWALCAACASGTSSSQGPAVGVTRDAITREALVDLPYDNAYEVVRALKPQWLRARRSPSMGSGPVEPVVFLDGRRYGPLDTLRDFRLLDVQEIRYLSPPDATTRYGTGYDGGIINVRTRS